MTASTRLVCAFAVAVSIAVCANAFASEAPAGTVFRCGNTYSSAPCVDGRAVEVDGPVTATRLADARRVAGDERRLAEQMARDRRADEAAIRPAGASSLGPSRPRADAKVATVHGKAKARTKKRTGVPDDDDFIAHVPKVKVAKN